METERDRVRERQRQRQAETETGRQRQIGREKDGKREGEMDKRQTLSVSE